jgi:hypothetical protein
MRWYAKTFLAAGWLFALAATPASAGDEDLTKALQKAAALERYAFQIEEKPGKGAGAAVEGAYQKGQPLSLKADKIEFFKAGDVLIYKQGDAWKRSKRGVEPDPLIVLGAVAKVNAARLPHEELAALGKLLEKAKKADRTEDGNTVYAGDLSEEAAKKLAPTESQGVARGGTAKVWVNGDGAVVKYALSIRLKGRQGNAEVDGTTEKSVQLREIGSAKVEVPEAAKKALESK